MAGVGHGPWFGRPHEGPAEMGDEDPETRPPARRDEAGGLRTVAGAGVVGARPLSGAIPGVQLTLMHSGPPGASSGTSIAGLGDKDKAG